MIPQERAPETPRAQASDNALKTQQAEFMLAQHRELMAKKDAAASAHVAAREAWRTVRIIQTPHHTQGPAAGLMQGDISGLPPDLAEAFVKGGLASYVLDPASPASPEAEAQRVEAAHRVEARETYEVAKDFEVFVTGDHAGFAPTLARPLVKSGHLRPLGQSPARKIIGRTLDAARRALGR